MNRIFAKENRSALLLITVAALGYFVDIYDLILFNVVKKESLISLGYTSETDLKNYGLQLFNWQMGGMLVGGILWGILGDKKGRLKVLFGSILMYSAANIANAFVGDITSYAIIRFIAGVGLAGELGAGITIVAEVMSKETRGYGTMIIVTFGALGAVLAAVFSLVNLNHWMLVNHFRPMMEALAVPTEIGIAAAAAIGPAQVIGRLVLMGARIGTGAATWATVGALVVGPGFLLAAAGFPVAAFGFAACQGAAMGVLTILRPMLVAETLGEGRYGAVAGMMAIPGLAATAVAPMLGAGLMALGGVWLMIGAGFALALAACTALAARR
jgi:MFS family permease